MDKTHILEFTTGGKKYYITEEEAKAIAITPDDESITISRLGLVTPKRMLIVSPINHQDMIEDRKRQMVGILHDGTRVIRHFGRWVIAEQVPDDRGNYDYIRLDPDYYPEVVMDIVATEKEFLEIQSTGKDYYEFLGIKNDIKRLNSPSCKRDFVKLLD